MITQLDCSLCFISESWESESKSLDELINMENFRVVTNVVQRENRGGKPALFISEKHFYIRDKELCPGLFTVPIGVEACWALLTPRYGASQDKIKHIAVCSYYYTTNTRRDVFIDHISEAYNVISAKYGAGTHFIFAGDTNRLSLKPILNLSPNLKQVVTIPTRRNPDAILDTIITTLGHYYHPPVALQSLQNDEDKRGVPSDHLTIYMRPISALHPKTRSIKTVTFRPLPDSGLNEFSCWIKSQKWESVYGAVTAHEKAEKLQQLLLEGLNTYLPMKTHKITSDDQPWYSHQLKIYSRQMKREYIKHGKSEKWIFMNQTYIKKCKQAKKDYYVNIVEDLKFSNPSKWYSKLKRMSSHNSAKNEECEILSLVGLPNQTQAEVIADEFSAVSNLYEPLNKDDISTQSKNEKPVPIMTPYFVHQRIKKLKNNSSTLKGDLPAKVIKMFGYEISFPLSNIFIRCCKSGEYPNIWKKEIVTPVPKQYPPEKPNQMRKISGTLNFSKFFEGFLADAIVADMADQRDVSQFGNRKGLSTQHYLIKMLHRILVSLDNPKRNESFAAMLLLIDWRQAFDRQCHYLGMKSFIANGVRNSIIPVLTNYFQDRKMQVKWKGTLSTARSMPGGGAQGSHLGSLEYDSQSNDAGNLVSETDRFKFVDDMSLLDILNLLACNLIEYDFSQHVASDIPTGFKFLPGKDSHAQHILDNVASWTDEKKMSLNEDKSKVMIINFTKINQFATRLTINDKVLETVEETKLLGSIISSDLTWHRNTDYLVKKGYQRLEILKKLYSFNIPSEDLVHIYILYVRSILKFNACVWYFSITQQERCEIERVQKVALKISLKNRYISY